MWLPSAAKSGANTLLQFISAEQSRRLRHPLLARQPLGLNGLEPRTLRRQGAGAEANALAGLLDLAVVLAHPRAHDLAVRPGGVVPDQEHGPLATRLGLLGTPAQEVPR